MPFLLLVPASLSMPVLQTSSKLLLIFCCLFATGCLEMPAPAQESQTAPPADRRAPEFDRPAAEERLQLLSEAIANDSDSIDLYSRRGDVHLFLGNDEAAVADYDRMIELSPDLRDSHWRRGIALYLAGEYESGAKQFDHYHNVDQVDRENGIWRYLCHHQAHGPEAARKELLRYAKDDREPFGDIYRVYQGEIEPAAIFENIKNANIPDDDRQSRLFYAALYMGLHDQVYGHQESAKAHLKDATENNWPQTAGFGPNYMWHVARRLSESHEDAQ